MHAVRYPQTIALAIALAMMALLTDAGQTSVDGSNGSHGEVTLSRCWNFPVDDGRTVTVDATRVIVGSGGAKLEAFAMDGKKLWATELGGEIASNVLVGSGGVFMVTSAVNAGSGKGGGTARFLSLETGITVWTAKLPEADKYSLGFGTDSIIVVTSGGTIEAFATNTGATRWRRELAEGVVGEPRFNHANVYLASSAKQIFTVSLASGEIVAVTKMQFAPTAVSEISGDIFIGDERGNVTSLGRRDKANWNFKSGGKISAIVEVGGNLLAASNDNFVYLFSGRSGNVAWKKRLNERVSQIGAIDDRFAIVSGYEENGAHLMEINSGKTVGQLNFDGDEFAVARPVYSNGRVFILTNGAIYSFSMGKICS